MKTGRVWYGSRAANNDLTVLVVRVTRYNPHVILLNRPDSRARRTLTCYRAFNLLLNRRRRRRRLRGYMRCCVDCSWSRADAAAAAAEVLSSRNKSPWPGRRRRTMNASRLIMRARTEVIKKATRWSAAAIRRRPTAYRTVIHYFYHIIILN